MKRIEDIDPNNLNIDREDYWDGPDYNPAVTSIELSLKMSMLLEEDEDFLRMVQAVSPTTQPPATLQPTENFRYDNKKFHIPTQKRTKPKGFKPDKS